MKKYNFVLILAFMHIFLLEHHTHAMKLFVKMPDNRTVTIGIEPTATIGNFKRAIQEETGYPSTQQLIILGGKSLDDTRLINSLPTEILFCVLKPDVESIKKWILQDAGTAQRSLAATLLIDRSCSWLVPALVPITRGICALLEPLVTLNPIEENRPTFEQYQESTAHCFEALQATANMLRVNIPAYPALSTYLQDPGNAAQFWDLCKTAPEAAQIIFRPLPPEFLGLEKGLFEKMEQLIKAYKYYKGYREKPSAATAAKIARFEVLARCIGFDQAKKTLFWKRELKHEDQWYFYISSGEGPDVEGNIEQCEQHDQSACQRLINAYKVHLMPREDALEKAYLTLLERVLNDDTFRSHVAIFKVLCDDEANLKPWPAAPKIVIYCFGKYTSQAVLDYTYRIFDSFKDKGCDYRPAFNERVTDFLYFAQGDRNIKEQERYKKYFEQTSDENTNMVYYDPAFIGIPKWRYQLKNPATTYKADPEIAAIVQEQQTKTEAPQPAQEQEYIIKSHHLENLTGQKNQDTVKLIPSLQQTVVTEQVEHTKNYCGYYALWNADCFAHTQQHLDSATFSDGFEDCLMRTKAQRTQKTAFADKGLGSLEIQEVVELRDFLQIPDTIVISQPTLFIPTLSKEKEKPKIEDLLGMFDARAAQLLQEFIAKKRNVLYIICATGAHYFAIKACRYECGDAGEYQIKLSVADSLPGSAKSAETLFIKTQPVYQALKGNWDWFTWENARACNMTGYLKDYGITQE